MTLWRDGIRVTETVAPATFVVAAADSYYRHRRHADFVCPAEDSLKFINDVVMPYVPTNGAKILLLDGTYKMSTDNSGITISQENVTICGQGRSTKFTYGTGIKGRMIYSTQNGTTIENIYLYGSTTGVGGTSLIYLDANYSSIRNTHSYASASLATANLELGNAMESVIANNIVELGYDGIYLDGTPGAVVTGNKVYQCSNSGIRSESAMYVDITGNAMQLCGTGIILNGTQWSNISANNVSVTSSASGIHLGSASSFNHISANMLNTIFTDGILIDGACNYNTIEGNHVEYCDADGSDTYSAINMANGGDNTITDNYILGGVGYQKYGIYVANPFTTATSTAIRGNRFTSGGTTAEIFIVDPGDSVGGGEYDATDYFDSTMDEFTSVKEADTNYIVESTDVSGGGPGTATIAHQPDVPRNVTVTVTQVGGTITAYSIEVHGYDAKGRKVIEKFTKPAGGSPWAQIGNRAFAKIAYVYWSVTGAGAGDTLIVGIGTILGLSGLLTRAADVLYVEQSGARTALYAASESWDTITPTSITEPDDIVVFYRACANELTRTYTNTVNT